MRKKGIPFMVGDYYHIFNRGAHKQPVFKDEQDRKRFLLLLLLTNTNQQTDFRTILKKYKGEFNVDVFKETFGEKIVDILAYTLMTNHFHLVLREREEGGISKFMRKLSTSYSMYFNARHNHDGVVFQGRYRCVHLSNEDCFQQVWAHILLNALDILDTDWRSTKPLNFKHARMLLSSYPFSSYFDYFVKKRPESTVLSLENLPNFLTAMDNPEECIKWEAGYSADESE